MPIATINPATGETLRTYPELTAHELEAKLAAAHDAFPRWRRTPLAERAAVVARAAQILDAEKAHFGRLMTTEMGKPIRAAEEEAAKCALGCRYYADHGADFLRDEPVLGDDGRPTDGFISFEPLGVVLAVMPWNFPFWQVIRFAAPALVAGNVGLLKHASNVPACALAIEELFTRAGAPAGVFQALLVGSKRVAQILADPRVAAATLTGSESAGSEVGATAGRHLKPSVLELGGSDPFIVMPSADVARAAEVAVKARAINNGQSCIAAKRFIVHRDVAADFERRFVEGTWALRVGDPLRPDTDIGPLATPDIREGLHRQVEATVAAGARLLTGGRPLEGRGNYYAPTVLADVPRGSPAHAEETFGPVAALFTVPDIDAAIALANDTTFGLGASAWTNDRAEAERFARELEAGQVFINQMVVSDPRFPFGGVKRSGYGRELAGYGLREFVNIKTVRMSFGGSAPRASSDTE